MNFCKNALGAAHVARTCYHPRCTLPVTLPDKHCVSCFQAYCDFHLLACKLGACENRICTICSRDRAQTDFFLRVNSGPIHAQAELLQLAYPALCGYCMPALCRICLTTDNCLPRAQCALCKHYIHKKCAADRVDVCGAKARGCPACVLYLDELDQRAAKGALHPPPPIPVPAADDGECERGHVAATEALMALRP
jgi:hypothetical protein